jgi:hypothetical protein
MKQLIASKGLTMLFVAVLAGSFVPTTKAATCSTATVAVDWGFTLTGTLLLPSGPAPLAAVTHGTADAQTLPNGCRLSPLSKERNTSSRFRPRSFKNAPKCNHHVSWSGCECLEHVRVGWWQRLSLYRLQWRTSVAVVESPSFTTAADHVVTSLWEIT